MGKPTQERLLALFDDVGYTVRRKVSKGKGRAGTYVTGTGSHGYYRVRVDGEYYLVHHVLWCMRYGYWPKYIDHINRNPLDNSVENLREVTHQQNMCNTRKHVNNTSGYRGVSWHKAAQKWWAQITYKRKHYNLGLFDCKEAARQAYLNKQAELHGEFSGEA